MQSCLPLSGYVCTELDYSKLIGHAHKNLRLVPADSGADGSCLPNGEPAHLSLLLMQLSGLASKVSPTATHTCPVDPGIGTSLTLPLILYLPS